MTVKTIVDRALADVFAAIPSATVDDLILARDQAEEMRYQLNKSAEELARTEFAVKLHATIQTKNADQLYSFLQSRMADMNNREAFLAQLAAAD